MFHLRSFIALGLASSVAFIGALTAVSPHALACSPDTVDIDRIVGFEADGRYVTFGRAWSSFDEDIADESFTLHDANGAFLGSIATEWDEKAKVTRWRAKGTTYFDGVAGKDREASRVEKALLASKKLTTSTTPRKVRHVKSERVCGSIELQTESGWLRVAERHEDYFDSCASFHLEAFEHPKTKIVFVRAKHKSRNGDFSTEIDTLIELSKDEIDGIALALRGERERLRGDVDHAIAHLEASIAKAPLYLPSRMGLARAYAKSGRKPARLLAQILRTIPEYAPLVGPIPNDEALRSLVERTWPGTALPEILPWDRRGSVIGSQVTF